MFLPPVHDSFKINLFLAFYAENLHTIISFYADIF